MCGGGSLWSKDEIKIDVECESNRVDKEGPSVRELEMQSLKAGPREGGKQETEVKSSADEVYINGEGLGKNPTRNFESKKVDNGGPDMRLCDAKPGGQDTEK